VIGIFGVFFTNFVASTPSKETDLLGGMIEKVGVGNVSVDVDNVVRVVGRLVVSEIDDLDDEIEEDSVVVVVVEVVVVVVLVDITVVEVLEEVLTGGGCS